MNNARMMHERIPSTNGFGNQDEHVFDTSERQVTGAKKPERAHKYIPRKF